MSVHIDYNTPTTNQIDTTVEGIIQGILQSVPAYISSYTYEVPSDTGPQLCGFSVYLKNIVYYILNPLKDIFDMQLNVYNDSLLASSSTNYTGLTNKHIICAQKICENIGILNASPDGFVIRNPDGTINSDRTLRIQLDYLKALYSSTVLQRYFDGTIQSYDGLLKNILPGSSIQILDVGTSLDEDNKLNGNKMFVSVSIDATYDEFFGYINKDILKVLVAPRVLGVSINVDLADITTMYWDGKDTDVSGTISGSTETEYANWDERKWVGEY